MSAIREQILQALQTKLEGITPANGFVKDATGRVHRAVRSHAPESLPVLVMWDGQETSEPHSGGAVQKTLPITVEVLLPVADSDNASVPLNEWLPEVEKALTSGDTTLTGLADRTVYQGAQPEYPQEQSDVASVLIVFQVIYYTVKGDPYTQP